MFTAVVKPCGHEGRLLPIVCAVGLWESKSYISFFASLCLCADADCGVAFADEGVVLTERDCLKRVNILA